MVTIGKICLGGGHYVIPSMVCSEITKALFTQGLVAWRVSTSLMSGVNVCPTVAQGVFFAAFLCFGLGSFLPRVCVFDLRLTWTFHVAHEKKIGTLRKAVE